MNHHTNHKPARRRRTATAAVLNATLIASVLIATFWITTPTISTAAASPEPNPVPRRWELRIEPGPLRLTAIETERNGLRPYWYFTYKVTNNSGEDRFFAPSFEISLDNGRLIRSGRNVPRQATETILARLKNPLLIDELAIQGTLLQGPENAKEGLAIFPADDLRIDVLRLFAAGFSGETESYIRPDTGERVTLRKQLMLVHQINGEADPKSDRPIRRLRERWVLR